jgi:NAD(P) transhydrogenase subunit alpha
MSLFMLGFIVFVLACFVGYHVIWNVTPALHTPLMAVTNAISGIIVVAAIVVAGVAHAPDTPTASSRLDVIMDTMKETNPAAYDTYTASPEYAVLKENLAALDKRAGNAPLAKALGFFAVFLAAINIFGGFVVTRRMLAMFRK